jgi:hypothetical protein
MPPAEPGAFQLQELVLLNPAGEQRPLTDDDELVTLNPARRARRRRTKHRRRRTIAAAINPMTRRHRRRSRRRRRGTTIIARRNPSHGGGSFSMTDATKVIGPALIGAGGAFGLNYALQYLPLPSSMQSGVAAYAVEAIGGIVLGVAAGAIAGRSTGIAVATGALTVVAYQVIAGITSGSLTNGSSTTSRFVPPAARRLAGAPGGAAMGRLGYQNPARIVGLPKGTTGFPIVGQRGMARFVPPGRM